MPCPWYTYGMCTSPKLDMPTDAVTSPERCLDDARYRTCPYYVEPSGSREAQSQSSSTKRRQSFKVYAPIHALLSNISIGCPFAEVMVLENGIRVAYCKILDRLLTRFEAELCAKHWKDCPYRAFASTPT